MTLVAIQPFFLPWLGTFNQYAGCDNLVFLDDFQYTEGWINRNRIMSRNGGLHWMTVPVHRTSVKTSIKDVRIASASSLRSIAKTLSHFYGKAPYYRDQCDPIMELLMEDYCYLIDLNIATLRYLLAALQIAPEIHFSSDYCDILSKKEGPTNYLIELSTLLRSRRYITGPSAKQYIDESQFVRSGICLEYHEFSHPQYPQFSSPFKSHLSIIDAIFHVGIDNVRKYVKSPLSIN